MRGIRTLGIAGIVAAFALAASAPCLSQPNLAADADASGPRGALERFLSLNAAAGLEGREGQALLTGQLANARRPTFGPLPAPDRIVMLRGARAVARLPAEGENRPDIYLYLSARDGAWTIDALRALALTGILREIRRQLRALGSLTPDQAETLANAELTLASDRDLRAWFGQNRTTLERLRQIAEAGRDGANENDIRIESPESGALLRRLHALLLSVSAAGVVRVTIGGMVDNEVGLLHASDPAAVPPIDSSDHIWIEPLGDGWYLFRTT